MKNIQLKSLSFSKLVVLILIAAFFQSCQKESEVEFKADFTFSFSNDNNVLFTNTSVGDYQTLEWNFGNGETASTTDKNKTFEVYYPKAGDYNVILNLLTETGANNKTIKKVTITNDDVVASFTATADAGNPNLFHLENTSSGEFDSFEWLFRYKTIENENSTLAYFPFSGTFSIELKISKGTSVFSAKQNVTIASNDADYLSNLALVWSDEFDGTAVNTDNWTFETGATGWGNNELENYTNGENSEIVDGKLVITAKKINESMTAGSYTSSRMITLNKHDFLYGRMEIRAKLPSGRGIWPAIWMLGSNIGEVSWPACGETDIMEYVGYQPNTVHATIHTPAGNGSNGSGTSISLATCEEEFHNYGIIWTEKSIQFYIDSPDNVSYTYAPVTKTSDNWPFNKPQFFILNVAVGGNWGGAQGIDNTIFPQKMEVDYVRVYQEKY